LPCSAEDAARLIEACRRLVSSLDLDEVMDRAVTSAAELLGADGACLLCLDEAGEKLIVERTLNNGEFKRTGGKSVPHDQGLAGLAGSSPPGNLCDDAEKDKRFDVEVDGLAGGPVRSLVTAALRSGDRPAGVIQVTSAQAGFFNPQHLEMLTHLAGLVAAAVRNARMHQREISAGRTRYELTVAADIQKNLLPTELPDTGSFDFDAVCLPAQEVGGDLYDLFPFPDGRLCAVLGDVSGKGVPAALYMTWMIAELRLLAERATDLASMMADINRRLCARSTRGMFVTLMAGLFSPMSGKIEVASAGHHPPLLRRRDGTVEQVPYPSAPPLGIVPGQTYPTACFQLARGEAALGFTDGVTEARNESGEEFGLERLKQAFGQGVGSKALRRVLRRLARFTGSKAQRDDTTMVLMWRKEA
jgi:phosphoserine phosphatase RsbU/P